MRLVGRAFLHLSHLNFKSKPTAAIGNSLHWLDTSMDTAVPISMKYSLPASRYKMEAKEGKKEESAGDSCKEKREKTTMDAPHGSSQSMNWRTF